MTNNEEIKRVATRSIKEQIEDTERNLERANSELIELRCALSKREEVVRVYKNDIVILKATYHKIVNEIDAGKLGDALEVSTTQEVKV